MKQLKNKIKQKKMGSLKPHFQLIQIQLN